MTAALKGRRRPGLAMIGAVLGLALLAGLVRASQPAPVHSETLYVFGTLVEVIIYGEREPLARAAIAALDRDFRRYHRDWHAWDKGGELGRLNDAITRGESFEASPELTALLHQGQELSIASGGLFEPAIGGLIGLWGFHDDLPPEGPLPEPAAIDSLVAAHPQMSDLSFDGNRITSANPLVRLDLGGYAKGAALDLAAQTLARRGISNAVLNAGGDINVLGTHGARDWLVAIRDPFGWGAVAALAARPGEVVYTSGNYERFIEQDEERFSHIIDPRSGWPVREIVSATVLDTNGARADAAATALSVAGPDHWAETARAMGIDAALLIDQSGGMMATPAMAARLEAVPGGDKALKVRIVELPGEEDIR